MSGDYDSVRGEQGSRGGYRDGHSPRGGGRGRYGGGQGGQGGHGGGDRRGIPLSALDASTTEASRKVIGAAIEVHKALGPGYDQQTYINALRAELQTLSVSSTEKQPIAVTYRDSKVGQIAADLFVEGKFLLDVLARPGPVSTFERLALRAKLKAADLELGLVINFAERRLKDGLVRVVNIDKITKEKGIALDDGEHEPGEVHEFDDR